MELFFFGFDRKQMNVNGCLPRKGTGSCSVSDKASRAKARAIELNKQEPRYQAIRPTPFLGNPALGGRIESQPAHPRSRRPLQLSTWERYCIRGGWLKPAFGPSCSKLDNHHL
jgi:hypothetical protein